MLHLIENHDVIRPLHDLEIAVVARVEHRRTGAASDNATSPQRKILSRIILTPACRSLRPPTLGSQAPFRRPRWQLAVRWINDQRRASVQGHHGLTAVQSELSKVVMHICDRTGLGLRGFPHGPTGGDSCQLFRRIERLGDIIRTLQPSIGLVGPEALKIRLTIGIARGPVGLLIA